MIYIRSILFNIFFFLWTALITVGLIPLILAPRKIAYYSGIIWSKGLFLGLRVIAGITYEERGKENLPKDGVYIVASKHQSVWETAAFLSLLNQPSFVLKQELLKIPYYGRHLISMGMIPIDRNGGMKTIKHMLSEIRGRLSGGQSIVIFPEGTRTTYGEKSKFHSGITFIYSDSQITAPIIPVALNSGKFWGRHSFIKYPGKIIVEYLPAISRDLDKKDFLSTLQTQIEEACKRIG